VTLLKITAAAYGRVHYVAREDMERVQARGGKQIPLRRANGKRVSELGPGLRQIHTGGATSLHVSYLEGAKIEELGTFKDA
jgi:hypothetical protein